MHAELARRYLPGMVIGGRYELVREIGHGGFGHVWIAKSQLLCNEVALKLLLREEAEEEDGVARLLREGRAAAAVDHPAVLRVFDFGETRFGDPFLVMELLRGENLEDLVAREGRIDPQRALRMILPVIHGLVAAHAKGYVHRDIKLANVYLSRGDQGRVQPKIIDFGLAKAQSGSVRITREGFLAGTPAYMSPEQARNEPLDARSDVWSVCVALYEMLTGRLPFVAETAAEAVRAIVESDPEPIPVGSAIDEALAGIVMKGLEKAPDARWSSMHDLGVALATWLEQRGVHEDLSGASIRLTWLAEPPGKKNPELVKTQSIPSPRRRNIAIAVLTLAAIVVVFLATRFAQGPRSDAAPQEATSAASPLASSEPEPPRPVEVVSSPVQNLSPAPVNPPRKAISSRRDRELGF